MEDASGGGAALLDIRSLWSLPFPLHPPSPRALRGSLPENKRKHSPPLRAEEAEVKGQLRSHVLEAKSPRGRPAASD